MEEKEISLLKGQREKLNERGFDLDSWKNQTSIFLQRIFGKDNPAVKMINSLKYDYSSWNLRDVAIDRQSGDPVKMQARQILDAAIIELETLGLPSGEKQSNPVWGILEEELTGKQIKALKEIIEEDKEDKMEKISLVLSAINKENLVDIISRLMVS